MKFQIISQENIQKSPEAKGRFSEWVDLCGTFSDKSDHLLVQCFMQLESWTYWPYPRLPSKPTFCEIGCNSEWEVFTLKLWKSLKWVYFGRPLLYQDCIQKTSFKTSYFWWWQTSPNSYSELTLEFCRYIPLLLGAHTQFP